MSAQMLEVRAHLDARGEYDGDFVVTRGGDVYIRHQGQVFPSTTRAGDIVSAAQVCEWQELGSLVKSADGWRTPQ